MSLILLRLAAVAGTALVVGLVTWYQLRQRQLQYEPHARSDWVPERDDDRGTPTCMVCHKPVFSQRVTLKCGHYFHRDCLRAVFDETLKGKRQCPVRECRVPISDSIRFDL